MIYLDNSATTKPYPEALAAYTEVASKIWGNPSSLHSLGSQATRLLEASRRQIAELLGKSSSEIFFTSGGTEGDNWVLKGDAFEKIPFGKHIIVSNIEHPAVKESALWLQSQGFEIDFAPVDKSGFVEVDKLAELIRPDTTLISIMAVNNEIGSIQPIQKISELLADKPTISFHVDAVQAVTKIPTGAYLMDRVDFATFSSHKFHGVRGVGFVYIKSGKKISPLLTGGGQESDKRSTTENLAGIAATAKALRLSMEKQEVFALQTAQMKKILLEELRKYPDVVIFSGMEDFAPVDKAGFVEVDKLAELIRPDTTLISIMAVNNEIGSIQPIQKISELLADKPTISFHVDAVQAVTKIPTAAYLTDRVDFATFSSHKFHGVRGVGFVYIKSGKKISPLLTGGGQESDKRSTTENLAGIAATAKALRLSMEKQEVFAQQTAQMKKILLEELQKYPDVVIFSDMENFAPHILTFGIKGVRGEVVVHAFEDYEIYISTTSACSSKAGKPAGTLIAMGVEKSLAQTAVRISLDLDNDMSQMEQFLTTFKIIYEKTRKVR